MGIFLLSIIYIFLHNLQNYPYHKSHLDIKRIQTLLHKLLCVCVCVHWCWNSTPFCPGLIAHQLRTGYQTGQDVSPFAHLHTPANIRLPWICVCGCLRVWFHLQNGFHKYIWQTFLVMVPWRVEKVASWRRWRTRLLHMLLKKFPFVASEGLLQPYTQPPTHTVSCQYLCLCFICFAVSYLH